MPYHVLCIEDEVDFREDVTEFLTHMGYRVTEASNGEAACALFNQKEKFDLILCDIRLPGCSGYEVLRRLRSMEGERQHTAFIFLSAMNDVPDMLEGRARGCDEYLVKPLNLRVLEATIRGRIERDHAARFMEHSVRSGLHSRMASLLMHEMALPFMELSHMSAQLQETVAEALPRKTLEKAGEIRRHAQAHAMRAQLITGFDISALQQDAHPTECASYGAQIATRVFGHEARQAIHLVASGESGAVPQREVTLALSMLLERAHVQQPKSIHGLMLLGKPAAMTIRIADRAEHLLEEEYMFHPWHDSMDVAAMGTALDGRMVPLLYAERLTNALGGTLTVKSVAQHFLVVEMQLPAQPSHTIAMPAIEDKMGTLRELLLIANENHYH